MANVKVMWGRGGAYNGQIAKVKLVDEQTMLEAGTWLATKLEVRTQSGIDEAGARFKPYSARYAEQKGVPRNRVDLTRTGEMFGAFGVLWASRNRVRIGFTSKAMEQRARYNEGMGRKFMGMSKGWLSELRTRLQKGIGFHRL